LLPQTAGDSDYDQRVIRLKEVQGSLIIQKWKHAKFGESEEIRRPGELYKRYRRIEELPENAKAFYELAGKLSLS
jgi:hypothetical protein